MVLPLKWLVTIGWLQFYDKNGYSFIGMNGSPQTGAELKIKAAKVPAMKNLAASREVSNRNPVKSFAASGGEFDPKGFKASAVLKVAVNGKK